MDDKVKQFLKESNAIEGVYDSESLDCATRAWNFLIKQEELTEEIVLRTHRLLMTGQTLTPDEIGYYRMVAVYIGGKEAIHYSEIKPAMDVWLKNVKASTQLPGRDGIFIEVDHIRYEKIHPFIDGNGRTGRMFMNWQRVKAGLPVLVIKESEKQDYYRWFQ